LRAYFGVRVGAKQELGAAEEGLAAASFWRDHEVSMT
jgi:hypothetical protein